MIRHCKGKKTDKKELKLYSEEWDEQRNKK